MCGIAGELRLDGGRPDMEAVLRMSARLARRGPDAEGAWQEGPVAFAHRRLAIIDLSERSRQPMVDASSGLSLVFNGTIYNYPELRAILHGRGHEFFSDGDTEVILRAYAEWGEDCVGRLSGMFAFAIWDSRRQKLFLARDRIGIKPLYFSRTEKHFRFASNMQALLAAKTVNTEIDPVALHHQFTLHAAVPPPFTILKGIRKLEQGTTLSIDINNNGVRIAERRYWSLKAQRPATPLTEHQWTEAIHESLRAAVKKRSQIADVKVGVLLSGGLDSSLLVALLAEQGISDLMTFSIGFEDHPEEKGHEFEYSDAVADWFGTRHHKYSIPNAEVLRRLPEAVDCMAEPMVSQDAVSFYLLSELVSKTVKVVQSGQGADEVFAGYSWHPKMNAEHGPFIERMRRHYFDRDHDEFAAMVEAGYQVGDVTGDLLAARLGEPFADEFIDQVLRAEATLLVTDDPVKRVDNMTMAWGLEARVPFLDHELVELAARIPPEEKLRDGGKGILKDVARKVVPSEVIDRKKGYFPVPQLKYIDGPYLDMLRDALSSQKARERGLFQRDYLERLFAKPSEHITPLRGSELWQVGLLEMWLQTQEA